MSVQYNAYADKILLASAISLRNEQLQLARHIMYRLLK